MSNEIFLEQVFSTIDFRKEKFLVADYEGCTFTNCTFASIDLFSSNFEDCEFLNCDLSMLSLSNTAWKGVRFNQCKMIGIHFENCNPFLFSVSFDGCQLNLASFYAFSMVKTHFKNCKLIEVDFVETNLASSIFENCDLSGAIFDRSNLEKVNFLSAYNYIIDLENNRVKKAQFSREGLSGLLNKYDIIIKE
jgi:uncharacterized protein YjbI with pentapeptide repeats